MKLTILNKNLVDYVPTTYGVNHFVYTENFNETLDSLQCRINHTDLIEIEPFDDVVVEDEDFKKYLMVDSVRVKQETFGKDNEHYIYEIELCSQTKHLEGIILPNLSITPLRSGTKRSVYAYLSEYLDLYGEKQRKQIFGKIEYTNKWIFSQRVVNKFSNIQAVEKQWNTPTLREVLNDLFMLGDCIPILSNNIIDYLDLTETKSEVSGINYIERSMTSDDYVSEIKMNMQNVLQTKIDNINNSCITSEFIPFSSTDYIITSNNIILETTFPILNVKSLKMGMYAPADNQGNAIFISKDLCNLGGKNYVKESKEYQTLKIAYRDSDIEEGKESEYQNSTIFFTRGSNQISGFTSTTKHFLWNVYDTLWYLKDLILRNQDETVYKRYNNQTNLNRYYSTFFEIEYETQTDQVFSASKEKVNNKRTIVDNQTNSWVEASSQGFLEYQKANRLGNEIYLLNKRVNSFDDVIHIGDYYMSGDDIIIVYQTQLQVYPEHIEINAYGTKDYILKNYFTGINSKIRTWVNAKDEAFVRHELIKYNCELSFENKNEIDGDYGFLLPTTKVNPLKYVSVNTTTSQGIKPTYNLIGAKIHLNNYINFLADGTYDFDFTVDNDMASDRSYFRIEFTTNGTRREMIWYYKTEAAGNQIFSSKPYAKDNSTGLDGWIWALGQDITLIASVNDTIYEWLTSNGNITDNTYTYANELVSRVIGNSIVFSTGFNDNYNLKNVLKVGGDSGVNKSDITSIVYGSPFPTYYEPKINIHLLSDTTLGGLPLVPLSYTDDKGEFTSIDLKFFGSINFPEIRETMNATNQINTYYEIMEYPLILKERFSDEFFEIKKQFHKDNKEIIKISTQFEIMGDKDVYVSPNYVKNLKIIQEEPNSSSFVFWFSDTLNRYEVPEDSIEIQAYNMITEGQHLRVNFYADVNYKYAYLTINNELVFVCKLTTHREEGSNANIMDLYLNVLYDRDKNIYDVNGNKIGEI